MTVEQKGLPIKNHDRFIPNEQWETSVNAIKRKYADVFNALASKQGEFIWREFNVKSPFHSPEIALLGFLPTVENSSVATQQGFFERTEGSGIPRILSYLQEHGYATAGCKMPLNDEKSLDILLEKMKNEKSIKIFGISAFTFEMDWAKTVAKAIKKTVPNIRLVLGGPHADASFVNSKKISKQYGIQVKASNSLEV